MKNRRGGFTIIELMIVLAIAGLILLMVFIAVPTLQRNARNHERKVAVEAVWSAMHEYYNTHGHYPLTDNSLCTAVPECSTFLASLSHDPQIANHTLNYVDNNTDHSYPYNPDGTVPDDAYDTIIIFPAHRCQRDLSTHHAGGPDYPVYTTSAGDNDFRRFSAYIILEHDGGAFCVDDIN